MQIDVTMLTIAALLMLAFVPLAGFADEGNAANSDTPINVDARWEPFVDLYLVDRMEGVTHEFHRPIQVRNLEHPPSDGYYATVIFDPANKVYRHYCRETVPGYAGPKHDGNAGEVTAYQESTDGVNWSTPELGLFEVNGSKANNYVLANMSPFSHNFSPFLDQRPDCPRDERYKALAGTMGSGGLVAFVSADGIRWRKLREEPVLTPMPGGMMFDSQNVAFWSEAERKYVAYCRRHKDGLRQIVRTASEDFLTWSEFEPVPANLQGEHLYTSQASPYFRAPHITIGLATRFLPNQGQSTDIVLLSSRNGRAFDRVFKEAFIRPAPLRSSWSNRGNFAALNIFPLRNDRPDMPDEWRLKIPEYMGMLVRDRLYYLPVDGFASIHAGAEEGEMTTRPLVFTGSTLMLNYETSAAGYIRVEILDSDGKPFAGRAIGDLKQDVWGNQRAQRVVWRNGTDLSALKGQTVRLRFVMREADLYAIRFADE